MITADNEQYRAGFEAWAKSRHLGLERARIVLADYARSGTEDAWQTWLAAKREASTEPSALTGTVADWSRFPKGSIMAVCPCRACNPHMVGRMMFICPNCGDKRCPHAADHREACGAGALPDEAKDAARLDWTAPAPPDKHCSYDRVTAQTPFGPIRIAWKGWKEGDSPTVDEHPVPDFFYAGNDVEDAKREAERAYFAAIEAHKGG